MVSTRGKPDTTKYDISVDSPDRSASVTILKPGLAPFKNEPPSTDTGYGRPVKWGAKGDAAQRKWKHRHIDRHLSSFQIVDPGHDPVQSDLLSSTNYDLSGEEAAAVPKMKSTPSNASVADQSGYKMTSEMRSAKKTRAHQSRMERELLPDDFRLLAKEKLSFYPNRQFSSPMPDVVLDLYQNMADQNLR